MEYVPLSAAKRIHAHLCPISSENTAAAAVIRSSVTLPYTAWVHPLGATVPRRDHIGGDTGGPHRGRPTASRSRRCTARIVLSIARSRGPQCTCQGQVTSISNGTVGSVAA